MFSKFCENIFRIRRLVDSGSGVWCDEHKILVNSRPKTILDKSSSLIESGDSTKDQLISKCPFGFIVWTKLPTKLFLNFCPEIFCTFLGASWKLFGASCRLPCLWYYILSPQEAQRASMKPPGSYKKNSEQKSRNNFVGIFVQTMKPKGHFEINWPLAGLIFWNSYNQEWKSRILWPNPFSRASLMTHAANGHLSM